MSRTAKFMTALVIALLLITAGVMRGEVHTVENKATNICMECIGIG